ncbi:MAG: hypothetical protein ACT4PT_01005 [Methanobacteriota archaeon]
MARGVGMAVALALTVVLSGCLTTGPTPVEGPGPAAGLELPARYAANLTDCLQIVALVLVPPEAVAARLPRGFRAADVASLAVPGLAAGSAALLLHHEVCADGEMSEGPQDWGVTGVFVEAPTVEGWASDANPHVYGFEIFATGRYFEKLRAWRYAVTDSRVTANTDAAPFAWSAAIDDAEGPRRRLEATTNPVAQPTGTAPTHATVWHDTEAGLVAFDIEYETTEHMGQARCEVREGSIEAEIMGQTDCEGLTTAGVARPSLDATAAFHFLRGIHATP